MLEAYQLVAPSAAAQGATLTAFRAGVPAQSRAAPSVVADSHVRGEEAEPDPVDEVVTAP